MSTLHILRSEPDEEVRELIKLINAAATGETKTIGLYDGATNYDDLVEEIFSHDHVISWW